MTRSLTTILSRVSSSSVARMLRGKSGVYLGAVAIVVFAGFYSPSFVNPSNLVDLARRASYLGVVAVGQTFVILTGGVDLSVGETISLTELLITETTLSRSEMLIPAILLCLGVGIVIGLCNGLAVTKLRLPPVVVTLATMMTLKGTYLLYTNAAPRGISPPGLQFWAAGKLGGVVPGAIVIWGGIVLAAWFVLTKTGFGRRLYATGGNAHASWISGVRTDRVIILAYVAAGLTAAVSGVLLAGFIRHGVLGAGTPYTMNSIAAAILGGATFAGARGTVGGTVGGVLFLTLLLSLLTVVGLPYSAKQIAQGLVILSVVLAYSRQRSRLGG
jgi:ribose transport system permease protein